MEKVVKFPGTWQEIVGVAVIAVAAIWAAKKLPVVKSLVG